MSLSKLISSPQLIELLAKEKVDVNQMTVQILKDLDEIRASPAKKFSTAQMRKVSVLMKMFTLITNFMAMTPELAQGAQKPEVSGARDSKANRKGYIGNYKVPRPVDALE